MILPRGNSKRKASIPNPDLPLNMIVDVPYFADSRHVGMLPIAVCFPISSDIAPNSKLATQAPDMRKRDR